MRKLALLPVAALALSACTPEMRYGMGSDFRRQQCTQNVAAERLACLQNADKSYQQYEDETKRTAQK